MVQVEGLGDGYFGAHPVGGGGQHRAGVRAQRTGVEETRKTADPADHLRPVSGPDMLAHQLHGPVAGLDVHPGPGVRTGHETSWQIPSCSAARGGIGTG